MSREFLDKSVPKRGVGCWKGNVPIFRCKRCHAGLYCSKDCQKNGWNDHKDLCENITKLDLQIKEKMFANVNFSSRVNLTPNEELKLVKLVGQKCTVHCSLDGVENVALWDTGAEVALIGQKWLNEKFPGKKIQDVSELLG